MQVEYIKDPKDVDEAVFEVVNYLETKKRSQAGDDRRAKQHGRVARIEQGQDSDTSCSEEETGRENRIARAPGRPPKAPKEVEDTKKHTSATHIKDVLCRQWQKSRRHFILKCTK
jgi:hypothetical protein